MIEIVPTNTCPPDFAELSRRSLIFAGFADQIQLDIDDGAFAPELSWPYLSGQWAELEEMAVGARRLPCADKLAYETHLMVEDPIRIGELLARVGCMRVIAHVEAFHGTQSTIEAFSTWRAAGAVEVGLAILIDTPLSVLEPHIGKCDVVQMMSIARLGAQGASFEPRVVPRIQELHAKYPDLTIAVDGGVSPANIAELVRAGATRFGVGSAIIKSPDPAATFIHMKKIAENALL